MTSPNHHSAQPDPVTGRETSESLRSEIAELAGKHGAILSHHERSWASVTFAGARHQLTIRWQGEDGVRDGERFAAFAEEHEFNVRGALVADCAITSVRHEVGKSLQADVEFLLVDDRP